MEYYLAGIVTCLVFLSFARNAYVRNHPEEKENFVRDMFIIFFGSLLWPAIVVIILLIEMGKISGK